MDSCSQQWRKPSLQLLYLGFNLILMLDLNNLFCFKCFKYPQIQRRQKYTPASMVFQGIGPFGEKETPCISTAPGLPVVHHDGYECYLPPDHRFKMRKFNKLKDVLLKDGVISRKQISLPVHATKEDVTRVHTEEYIGKFFEGRTSDKEQRMTGFKWSEGLVSRCRYETGGTILAAEIAMERGLVCSTGGGTHHAFPDHGAGFCLLNDMAVASRHMIADTEKVDRVLIVDLDVHQVIMEFSYWGYSHSNCWYFSSCRSARGGGGYSDLVPTGVCRWSRQTRTYL